MPARHRANDAPTQAAREAVAGLTPAVVISGGSRGLGLALAKVFAARGSRVAIIARDQIALTAAAHEIEVATGVKATAIVCDVTSTSTFATIAEQLQANRLYLDVLVNNAGIGLAGPFLSHDDHDIDRLIAINIASLTRLTRRALPDLIARRRGGIINIASLGAYVPGAHQAAYYASKAYVLSLTEALATECSGTGVKIAVAVPGPINTTFHANMGANHTLYRTLIPQMQADRVARSIYLQFTLGKRVILPGIVTPCLALALKYLPHPITVPLVAWLLKKPTA